MRSCGGSSFNSWFVYSCFLFVVVIFLPRFFLFVYIYVIGVYKFFYRIPFKISFDKGWSWVCVEVLLYEDLFICSYVMR